MRTEEIKNMLYWSAKVRKCTGYPNLDKCEECEFLKICVDPVEEENDAEQIQFFKDAADLIEQQQKEIEQLKAKQARWIPVSERLPECDKYGETYVLVCMDDEFIATTTYIENEGFELWAESGEVIAWQPLPEPYHIGEANSVAKEEK